MLDAESVLKVIDYCISEQRSDVDYIKQCIRQEYQKIIDNKVLQGFAEEKEDVPAHALSVCCNTPAGTLLSVRSCNNVMELICDGKYQISAER